MPWLTSLVVSTTLESVDWQNGHFIHQLLLKNRAPIYGGLLLITPTFSIRILTQGVGIDKENKVNNLKILDYLRVGFFFRVELAFIDRKEKISAFPKTQSGI